jgi:hypothetical protein
LQNGELFNNELLAHFVEEQLCAYNKASINTSNEKGQIFMYYGMNQVEGPSAHKEAGEPTRNEPEKAMNPPGTNGVEGPSN